jgi:hypothetical protein
VIDSHHLRLIVIRHIGSIFVQVRILWFTNREQDHFKFYKLWSSSAFMAISEKKGPCRRKDLKHKYDADGHVCKSKHIVKGDVVLSSIYML